MNAPLVSRSRQWNGRGHGRNLKLPYRSWMCAVNVNAGLDRVGQCLCSQWFKAEKRSSHVHYEPAPNVSFVSGGELAARETRTLRNVGLHSPNFLSTFVVCWDGWESAKLEIRASAHIANVNVHVHEAVKRDNMIMIIHDNNIKLKGNNFLSMYNTQHLFWKSAHSP